MKALRSTDPEFGPMRFCRACDEWLPENKEFWSIAVGRDGTTRYWCKRREAPGALPPPPACMTAQEFALWRAANRKLKSGTSAAKSPCFDCPLGFAADMRTIGMCDGQPGGVPEEDDEPVPTSRGRLRSWAAAAARYRARLRGAA